MSNEQESVECVLNENVVPFVNINNPSPLFDSRKNKFVKNNRKNRNRLICQGDLQKLPKSSTFMTRLNFKLQKLKTKSISISFKEIKENFPNNCITKFGIHVINKLPNTMIIMRIGNKQIPFNIDNIRELNHWFSDLKIKIISDQDLTLLLFH